MKTLFFKNVMPAAAAVLAIAGAFATTSMQGAEKNKTAAIQQGYYPDADGKCTQGPVNCSNILKAQFCLLNVNSGPIVYETDEEDNCVMPLYRIVNGQ
ncbi:hypothetical protein J2Y38_002113 [Flavobacterium sp. 2755]|uniref:DUF6520 family protein n=1 Tax=Flavobacterium sp. 2755 TaxID=2817765 RepID=UPI002862F4D0|nr:DUF6520 family protein [Flavobacterium sp. 2755]MDR6761904.1 hypothetical protein [Flavobacterium sp. 2755]